MGKKRKRKKKLKIALLIVEIIIFLMLVFAVVMVFMPNSKVKLIKAVTSCAPGRSLIACLIGGDYEKYLQDSSFDSDKIDQNADLTISEKFTNIALFGTDTRSGEMDGSHTDSIIIVSMNNETGEVKMVSVYRDTILEYVVDDKIYYDKATTAFARGGAEATINMLNTNLDLNIKDYAIVNFAGLSNIIDAMGGIDLTITKDEMEKTNGYLGETREVTGMTTLNLTEYGDVHMTGLQATAYCRIRDGVFHFEDGTTVNNDYGRAARQRLVLQKLADKAKSAGASDMLSIAKTIFKENTGDDQFLITSLQLPEILKMIPTVLEFNITGNQGFPIIKDDGDFTAVVVKKGKKSDLYTQSSVFVVGLEDNVKALHEYLFGEKDYEPTKNVQEINDLLIDLTGRKPETQTKQSTEKTTSGAQD